MRHQKHSQWVSAVLGTTTLAIGLVALVNTDPTAGRHSVLQGQYQRVIEKRFDENIPLRSIAMHAWTAAKIGLFNQPGEGAYIGVSGRIFTTEELILPDTDMHFATELQTAKSVLSGHGITLLPVIVPDKARIYSKDLGRARSGALETRFQKTLARIQAVDLPVVDLVDALQPAPREADTYMWTDTHWSPHGAQRAAKAIAGVVDGFDIDRVAFKTHASGPHPFVGDLISFADTGPFRNFVGPARETISRFETTAVAPPDDLFGDVSVPVALVGTSFSARQDFNFGGFLKQETGLDLINYAQSGTGPFLPMRRFLTSDALHLSPPKIVIWEIPERYISPKDL